MKNLIQIQQDYMDTVSAGMDRWSHRRDGGHSHRIRAGAYRKGIQITEKVGIHGSTGRDAHDVMMLERAGVDDPLNFAV